MALLLLPFMMMTLSACRADMATAERTTNQVGGTGKMTVDGQAQAEVLRMGIRINLQEIENNRGLKIARAFEEQLNVFEPCLAGLAGTKGEVLKLTATFTIGKDGLLSAVKVTEMLPQVAAFSECFLKQSNLVDVGTQSKPVTGKLTLGTFYGAGAQPKW
jgi:hypothetical protein